MGQPESKPPIPKQLKLLPMFVCVGGDHACVPLTHACTLAARLD